MNPESFREGSRQNRFDGRLETLLKRVLAIIEPVHEEAVYRRSRELGEKIEITRRPQLPAVLRLFKDRAIRAMRPIQQAAALVGIGSRAGQMIDELTRELLILTDAPCPIEEDMSQRLRKALVIFEGLFRDRLELIGDGSPEVREEVGLGRIVVEERRTRDLRLFGDLIGTHAIDIALGQ